MFRLIENWPQLRATIVNINMDLHSLVRSIRTNNNNNVSNSKTSASASAQGHREAVAQCHADRPARLDRLLEQEPASLEAQVQHSWSLVDKSPHINIRDEGLVGKRRPVAKSTDCIRGRTCFTKGLHVWTIKWPSDCRGTHAMVGVATEKAPLQTTGQSRDGPERPLMGDSCATHLKCSRERNLLVMSCHYRASNHSLEFQTPIS